jgi:cysteine desulfurase
VEECQESFDHLSLETARLRDKLEKGIQARIPNAVIFFKEVERLPNCCAIGFPGVDAEALLFLLSRRHVSASMGGGAFPLLSRTLIATGIDPVLARCALSFALSSETTEEEIDYAVRTISYAAEQLQLCSHSLTEGAHV